MVTADIRNHRNPTLSYAFRSYLKTILFGSFWDETSKEVGFGTVLWRISQGTIRAAPPFKRIWADDFEVAKSSRWRFHQRWWWVSSSRSFYHLPKVGVRRSPKMSQIKNSCMEFPLDFRSHFPFLFLPRCCSSSTCSIIFAYVACSDFMCVI